MSVPVVALELEPATDPIAARMPARKSTPQMLDPARMAMFGVDVSLAPTLTLMTSAQLVAARISAATCPACGRLSYVIGHDIIPAPGGWGVFASFNCPNGHRWPAISIAESDEG